MVSKRTSRNVRLKARFEVIQLKHWLEDTQRLLHENIVEEDPHPSGVGQSNGVQGRQQIAAGDTEPCGCS